MLNELFASETIIDLLTTFFVNPQKSFYLRELAQQTGKYPQSISQALAKLERAEVVSSTKEGNQKHYRLNPQNPIYSDLKSLIFKTNGIGKVLRGGLKNLSGLKQAFIYESLAREGERLSPEINLMLIGRFSLNKASKLMIDLETRLGQAINLMVFDSREWQKRKQRDNPFVRDILRIKKIMIVGEEGEL
ncbi:ArsR/SmtB family transcription factor [Patescibacteria group bacterium]